MCVKVLTDCIIPTYPPLSSRLQFDPKQRGIRVSLPCISSKVSIPEESQELWQPSGGGRTERQVLLGWGLEGNPHAAAKSYRISLMQAAKERFSFQGQRI